MLNSIFKNNIINENNIIRKKNRKSSNNSFIILCVILTLFIAAFNFYNSNKYSYGLSKIINKTNNLLVAYGFQLKNIYITGEQTLRKKVILDIVNNEKYKTIFDVNLFKIYNNLLLNDWIETVQIERILPNSIKIKILEKKPLAIWQTKLGNKLITKDGSIITAANITFVQSQLPIITGEEGNKNTFLILQILKKIPNLYSNVWSISYINKRRWDVYLKQGIKILLPSENIDDAWEKIHILQKKYKILDIGLTEIDIRNKKQVFGKININKKLYLDRKKL